MDLVTALVIAVLLLWLLLVLRRVKRKKAAAFGSYGWSGEASKLITEHLQKAGFEIVNDGIRTLWVPDEDALKQAREFGEAFAAAL